MTRRPPCSRFCPLILDCQECDWQSLTPAPFIVGVSAGGEACRPVADDVKRETMEASEMKTARLVTGPNHHIRLRSL